MAKKKEDPSFLDNEPEAPVKKSPPKPCDQSVFTIRREE